MTGAIKPSLNSAVAGHATQSLLQKMAEFIIVVLVVWSKCNKSKRAMKKKPVNNVAKDFANRNKTAVQGGFAVRRVRVRIGRHTAILRIAKLIIAKPAHNAIRPFRFIAAISANFAVAPVPT